MKPTGIFYIVSTPIGNLKDITLRALEILQSVDLIAAEDTRHSQRLLHHYKITTPLISFHEHNEQQRLGTLLNDLQQGKNIALISDAGTPLINDPGYQIVAKLHQANIKIVPIPGPCALIAGLIASGLPTDQFIFTGFLPHKGAVRRQQIQSLINENRTIILYESAHRIINLFELLVEIFGSDRRATIAREITKIFETIRQDTLGELKYWINNDPHQQKGEFVIIIEGRQNQTMTNSEIEVQNLIKVLIAELPIKQAVSLAAKISGKKRNELYQLALNLLDK